MALSLQQREEVRRRAAAGEAPSTIAKSLGVGRTTVWRLLKEASVPRSPPPPEAQAGAAVAAGELAAAGPGAGRHVRAPKLELAAEASTEELRDAVRRSLVAQMGRLEDQINAVDAAIAHELAQGEAGAELRPSRVRELVWSRATLQDKLVAALSRIEEIDQTRPKVAKPVRVVFRPRVVRLEDGDVRELPGAEDAAEADGS